MELLSHCKIIAQSKHSKFEQVNLLLQVRTSFDGFKSVTGEDARSKRLIARLVLSRGTLIIVGNEFWHSGKLRADHAKVSLIYSPRRSPCEFNVKQARSCHDRFFKYVKGKTVYPLTELLTDLTKTRATFDRRYTTCSRGIHFFMHEVDAKNYY